MTVAIVTGAGRGIGRAVAKQLASDGAAIVLVARSEDQVSEAASEIRADRGTAAAFAADVARPEGVAEVAARTEREFGQPCKILVNAAGITGPVDELADVD